MSGQDTKLAKTFKSENKVDRVTKQCEIKSLAGLTVIDTPGTNPF